MISCAGMLVGILSVSSRAEDIFSVQSYRVKGSGENLTPKNSDGKDGGIAVPQAAPPARPPDFVYHQVENPKPLVIPKHPDVVYVNHEVFGDILRKYATKSGWVDYGGLKRDKEAMANLEAYVRDLSALNPSTLIDPQDKLASWLNLYDAMVMWEILKYYPIDSLLKIPNFYGAKRFKIGDKIYSLYEIEELFFHQELQEPRTILARVMGSTSGARMMQTPFDARKIDKQLEDRTMAFLTDPKNIAYNPQQRSLALNPTLLWYEQEFVDLRGFLATYLPQLPPNTSFGYFGYDWKLNDSKLH